MEFVFAVERDCEESKVPVFGICLVRRQRQRFFSARAVYILVWVTTTRTVADALRMPITNPEHLLPFSSPRNWALRDNLWQQQQ